MTYAPITISGVVLTINGTDYSDEMISFDVSDDSLISSTLLTTNGTIQLAQSPFGLDVDNFIGTDFEIGKKVDVDIRMPNGSSFRHPRGRLYITGRSYNFETSVMELEVGCSLAFMLTFDEENLNDLAKDFITTFTQASVLNTLEPCIDKNIGLLRNLLLAEGAALYQDQFGNIQKIKFADSIGWGKNLNTIPHKFTVSDQYGLISIAPNHNAGIATQTIGVLQYDVFGLKDKDENFTEYKTDQEYDDNNYCAVDGECDPKDVKTKRSTKPDADKTENKFEAEDPTYKYKLQSAIVNPSKFTSVKETSETKKKYLGPGRQVSKEITEDTTDKMYVKFASYHDAYVDAFRAKNPNSSYFYQKGLFELGYFGYVERKITIYQYGTGGQLKTKIEETYKPGFTSITPAEFAAERISSSSSLLHGSRLMLAQKVTTNYEYRTDFTEEITETRDYFTYKKTGGEFISVAKRTSGGNLANPEQQDYLPSSLATNVCSPKDQTTSSSADRSQTSSLPYDPCGAGCPTEQPNAKNNPQYTFTVTLGPKKEYTLSGSGITKAVDSSTGVNYPLSFKPAKSRQSANSLLPLFQTFVRSEHIKRNASRYGFTVQMPLMAELFSYYPSYPFRLSLVNTGKHYHMAANAVTWSLSQTEAVCSIEGLMVGELTGVTNFAKPSYSPTFYPVPPTVTPTTGNNTTTNQSTTVGTTIQTVTVSSGSTTTTSVPVTSLPTVTATSFRHPVIQGGAITFNATIALTVKDPAGIVLTPVPGPNAVNFSVPITLTIGNSVIAFGSIGTPAGSAGFGTIVAPGTAILNAGTILVPNF